MKIGDIARQAGVNVQTIRFYERRGVLTTPSRLASGYRTYSVETVLVIRFIRQSQDLGFSLDEIKQLLSLRARHGGNAVEVRKLAEAKVEDIEKRISSLGQMRDELKQFLTVCRCGDERHPNCPALETLGHFGKKI